MKQADRKLVDFLVWKKGLESLMTASKVKAFRRILGPIMKHNEQGVSKGLIDKKVCEPL